MSCLGEQMSKMLMMLHWPLSNPWPTSIEAPFLFPLILRKLPSNFSTKRPYNSISSKQNWWTISPYSYRLHDGVSHDRLGMLIVRNENILEILQSIKAV